MTAHWPSEIDESSRGAVDSDVQARCAGNGRLAMTIIKWRAKREQRRREQREFKAWLEITAHPL
ncbi:MAG: hypothetical protein WCB92_16990 [Mycobacterium sp.]